MQNHFPPHTTEYWINYTWTTVFCNNAEDNEMCWNHISPTKVRISDWIVTGANCAEHLWAFSSNVNADAESLPDILLYQGRLHFTYTKKGSYNDKSKCFHWRAYGYTSLRRGLKNLFKQEVRWWWGCSNVIELDNGDKDLWPISKKLSALIKHDRRLSIAHLNSLT